MAKGKAESLFKEYGKSVRRNRGDSEESIEILKAIVQTYVEDNDDDSAYAYQQKVCAAYAGLYGEESIRTERARLYCRELMIRSASPADRVRLYGEFWEDVKRDYGEHSATLRILAPMYMALCYEAGEIEELRILCAEAAALFSESEDEEGRQFAAMCADFDIICGEKSGDITQLEAACGRAETLFGKDSVYALRLRNETGLLYKARREFEEAAKIHGGLYRLSQVKYGRYALDTIRFGKNYVLELAAAGHPRKALAEARRLERAAYMCPDRNQCPDIYECFVVIYTRLGKGRLAEKYGKKSLAFQEWKYGADSLEALKVRYMQAFTSLMFRPKDSGKDLRAILEYVAAKTRHLYGLYLLSSDAGRETYFTSQNRGEYDACLGVVLSGLAGSLSDEDLFFLWETVCNYKTLMGDCEFLHNAISRRDGMAEVLGELKAAMQSEDRETAAEAERRILQLSRSDDFPEYVNSVNVREVRDALEEGELLLDYYCVRFSDLEVYAAMAVTRRSIRLVQLGAIGEVRGLIEQTAAAVCGNTRSMQSDGDPGDESHEGEVLPDGLRERLIACLMPQQVPMPERIILCPDGELYHFAFDLLFPDVPIIYVTNPKDIARGRNKGSSGSPAVKTVHVFADPLFELQEAKEAYGASGWQEDGNAQERACAFRRLPGTMVEAGILRGIYGNRARVFARADASRQMFLRHYNADILHFGTHADSENGGKIYLSGANGGDQGEIHPIFGRGYITSKDISALNLGGTKLAVLSACRTGIGEYRDYLGERGLRRAFQIAGTHAVMAAFWNISDMATAVFMYEFYRNYNEDGDCVKALCLAKRYLRTADVRQMKEQVYPMLSGILADSGYMEAYKELREILWYGRDEDKPFSAPCYWAAFSIYDTFRD